MVYPIFPGSMGYTTKIPREFMMIIPLYPNFVFNSGVASMAAMASVKMLQGRRRGDDSTRPKCDERSRVKPRRVGTHSTW